MRARVVLSVVLGVWAIGDLKALDLSLIKRAVSVEPTYESNSPKYCLLAFGTNAETRVWVVVDGSTVYIDRNGNGDLTDKSEQVRSQTDGTFHLGQITEIDGKTTHTDLTITVRKDSRFSMSVVTASQGRKTVGVRRYPRPQLSDRAQAAPIIHLNGPISVAPYSAETVIPRDTSGRSYRKTWLRLTVGSPGLGPCTVASYDFRRAIQCNRKVRNHQILADIEFPNQSPKAGPISSRQTLDVKG